MNIITLDYETFFSDTYTLSKSTTEAYCRDPQFEVHGAAVRMPDGDTSWFLPAQLYNLFAATDWSQTALLCHHAHFDGLILAHHFGIKPALWLDTLSMARMLVGNHLSVSLESLAKHFGLSAKTIPYNLFKGKHWHELATETQRAVGDGACQDVQLTWDIFNKLAASFPAEEYALVDATVRMFTEPKLVGNTALLGEIWSTEAANKAALLASLGVSGADLRSDATFARLLEDQGVEVGTKTTEKGNVKYAFAKTDDFMRDLLEDENDAVATLAEARLSEKSNAVQTRTERLGTMSTRGAMCVYLNYCGAHTTRWSGGDKVNWQNLKRGGPIGKAICAPPGFKLVINDASQIECRLLNMVAGQHDVIERFRNKEDPYVALATAFYGEQVYKPKQGDPRYAEMEAKRGTGKQGELSCGYGAGDLTIQATAKKGTYGPPVYLTLEDAKRLKDTFRGTHPAICAQGSGYWTQAGRIIARLAGGDPVDWGPFHVADGCVWLPNGAPIIYTTLEHVRPSEDEVWHSDPWVSRDGYWRVKTRRGWSKLYGAKLVENVIQGLARVHVSQAWLRCKQAGIDIVSSEHDKLIAVVKEHEAEAAFEYMRAEMSRAPVWLPGVPLDSEGYISDTFAKPE